MLDPQWKVLQTPDVSNGTLGLLLLTQLQALATKINYGFLYKLKNACLTQTHTSCKGCKWRPDAEPNRPWDELNRANTTARYRPYNSQGPYNNITQAELCAEYIEYLQKMVAQGEVIRAHFNSHENLLFCSCGEVKKSKGAINAHKKTISCRVTTRRNWCAEQGLAQCPAAISYIFEQVQINYEKLLDQVAFPGEEERELVESERKKALADFKNQFGIKLYQTAHTSRSKYTDDGVCAGWLDMPWMPAADVAAIELVSKLATSNITHSATYRDEFRETMVSTVLNYLYSSKEDQENLIALLELQRG